MLGRLNHIAIAVPCLSRALQLYQDVLGAKVSKPLELPEHGVITVFVELDNTKLELLHPLDEHSPITKFLDRNPEGGIHHFCIEVSDIATAFEAMRAKGIRPLGEPKIGAHGKPVIFLHPKDCLGCLVEFEQGD